MQTSSSDPLDGVPSTISRESICLRTQRDRRMDRPERECSLEGIPLQEDTTAPGGDDPGPLAERIQKEIDRLRQEAGIRSDAAKKLAPLAKPAIHEDLEKYKKQLAKLHADLDPGVVDIAGLRPLLEDLDNHAANAARLMRRRLSRELKGMCEREGLGFRVIRSEDPIELRIPPLSVEVEFKRGQASVRFARQEIHSCPADPAEILKGRRAAMRQLDTPFDPAKYFEMCRRAYRASLADAELRPGDRVEILSFLPHLALQLQSKRFRADPTDGNYRGYSRASFAYDVLRLRRARALEQGGQRIEFGVATGTSATNKARVVYLEDEEGRGEYKLTVHFREVTPREITPRKTAVRRVES
jgi:hypothetical protein